MAEGPSRLMNHPQHQERGPKLQRSICALNVATHAKWEDDEGVRALDACTGDNAGCLLTYLLW